MVKKILVLIVMVVFILSSCYYHKEDVLYPPSTCDTTHITYSTTINGIFNNYGCLGCHVGVNPPGGINLETYSNVKIVVDNGRLYGAITHSPGFRPMPDGAAKMNECDINKVKAWINTGAPNN